MRSGPSGSNHPPSFNNPARTFRPPLSIVPPSINGITFFHFPFSVLAQRGYFKDPTFINYLKYLLYWKEPEYARYLKYPMCLYFLDLLQYEHFRREIVNSQCCKFIDDQAILLWQHYTRRRTKLFTMHNGVVQMEPVPIQNGPPQQNGTASNETNNGGINSKMM